MNILKTKDGKIKLRYKLFLILIFIYFAITNIKYTNEEVLMCKIDGGDWKEFSNYCVDECKTGTGLNECLMGFTYGCDCGKNKCWTGNKCIDNIYPN